MSFICYPILISKVEGEEVPSPESVISELLNTCEIAVNVITDKESAEFKVFQKQFKVDIEYIIVTIKYLTKFNA